MARYPNATWRGPPKHGYPNSDIHLKQGVVIHSVEGSLAGAFAVLDGPREASFHFTVAQDGRVFQHVDTEQMAWTNGSYESNRRFWGIECEGGGPNNMGEPLTAVQLDALIEVVRWLWASHTPYPFERRVGAWEHNEMKRYGSAPTSCPSGRIPWETIIAALLEPKEEDMTPEDRTWIGEQLASVVTQVSQRIDEQGGVRDEQAAAILAKIAAIQIGSGMTEAEFAALVARIELVVQ